MFKDFKKRKVESYVSNDRIIISGLAYNNIEIKFHKLNFEYFDALEQITRNDVNNWNNEMNEFMENVHKFQELKMQQLTTIVNNVASDTTALENKKEEINLYYEKKKEGKI